MNIVILGNGGREKIIHEKLSQYGNVTCLTESNFENIKNYCIMNNVELLIPSLEKYLCDGIVDYFTDSGIKVFGPTKKAANIEGCKLFSKWVMVLLGLPTSKHMYYTNFDNAIDYCNEIGYEKIVIKYPGLYGGKGVCIPDSKKDCKTYIKDFLKLNDGVIIEDKIYGKEVSVMAFCNGKKAYLMPQAQDYKRIYDGDKGLNTGGMGSICPANILTETELISVNNYMNRVVEYLDYKGVLYAGIMKTKNGISFLEFNCRFGDPETQAVLSLLKTNLLNIMFSCVDNLNLNIEWENKCSANVVLSHESYPMKKSECPLKMTYGNLDSKIKIYESNVELINNTKYTTGGRVLSVVSVDNCLQSALQNVYNNIYKIKFDGCYYRRDIGINNNLYNNSNNNIGIMASGNGTSIDLLLKHKRDQIKIIFTNKINSNIKEKAFKNNIPFFCFERNKESKLVYYEKIINIFRQFHIDIIILSGYMDIVPKILHNEFFTINIHPSLLPKYKCMIDLSVHNSVINNKDKFTGCTLHIVTDEIDGGRILKQKQCLVNTDNPETLKKSVQKLEQECIYEFICEYSKKIKYTVNIEEGNQFVSNIKKNNENITDEFASYFHYDNKVLSCSADGCGTKIDLSCRFKKLNTIGIDLVAMNVNDLIASGSVPLFFMDYIAIDSMDNDKCCQIIKGVEEGCRIANCKLVGGETAEMQGIYMKDKLDLAGFCVGEKKYLWDTKEKIDDSCLLYGIESSGIHSNGYTLVRKLLENETPTQEFIDKIMKPTKIYMDALKLYEEYSNDILGVAHITGGGFKDNIQRILPNNVTYKLDNWEFSDVFTWIQEKSNMSKEDMLSIFNCGYGLVIVSSKELPLKKIGKIINISE